MSCDNLLNGRVKLLQPDQGYRTAIDPIFLAAAVPAANGEKVLDLGSGTGAASICLAARIPGAQIKGLELQLDLVEMANQSTQLNKLNDRVCFYHGDLLFPPKDFSDFNFDHIMANPPYLKNQSVVSSPNLQKKIANVEGEALLSDWLKFAIQKVRIGGTITFVHRYDRRDEVVSGLAKGAGKIKVFPLCPRVPGSEAKRVIIQGEKGSNGKLKNSAGIVLYNDKGNFTAEANRILMDAGGLNLRTACE